MDYNETLNLPKTAFGMRAGLPAKEPEMLKDWAKNSLYSLVLENNRNKPLYILHDGPPFANNDIHMGTALNKVLKDIVVRSKNMCGYKAPFVPGWDTHGLAIERKALEKVGKEGKDFSALDLRGVCREFALHYVDVQREQFLRLGSLGEYDRPYFTLSPGYEANQIELFGEIARKGYIYKSLKPVYWCPNDQTALAEAEIEYENDQVDSIYVAFRVSQDNGALAGAGLTPEDVWFVIWTTTAWTLPGNVAIALGKDYNYAAVKAGGRVLLMAESLVESTLKACGIEEHEIVAAFKGEALEGIETRHIYLDRASPVILSSHVTLENGSGCVHIAPGHGLEDYEVVSHHYPKLPILVPVAADGILTEQAGRFAGLSVFKAGPAIQQYLMETGHLLGIQHMVHSYPHCWRCHSPVIFRATEQWFCAVECFKPGALKAVDTVEWIPGWGRERMEGMIRDRADWTLSRQRLWGVPIPVFYCTECGEYHIDSASIKAVADLFRREGSDGWFKNSAAEILPKGTVCKNCGSASWRKETDTMDVWLDSGTSHETVLGPKSAWKDMRRPADLYMEGSDQFRGWFQSSLLTCAAVYGIAPYKTVVSCGWVVDGEGRKMSKSLGNGIAPAEIIRDYGADIVRLWAAASDYQSDVRISKDILKQLSEAYRKMRNTARFMLANISDFDPDTESVPTEKLHSIDKWALAQLGHLAALAREGYESFDFHRVYQGLHRFCVVSMSNFYLDIIKDRLYISPAKSEGRRAAQTAMFTILTGLNTLLAPILAFTSQEIWDYVPAFTGKQKYVLLHQMPRPGLYGLEKAEQEKWEKIIAVNGDVKKVLEAAREEKLIGSSLEAGVLLYCAGELYAFLERNKNELADVFIVSQVELLPLDAAPAGVARGEVAGLGIAVRRAEGEKCQRCWQYRPEVGHVQGHIGLCGRCATVIKEIYPGQ